jgi:hypothetical protein
MAVNVFRSGSPSGWTDPSRPSWVVGKAGDFADARARAICIRVFSPAESASPLIRYSWVPTRARQCLLHPDYPLAGKPDGPHSRISNVMGSDSLVPSRATTWYVPTPAGAAPGGGSHSSGAIR